MIAPSTPWRHGLRLRPVDLDDAAFIIAQRTHPRARSYLGDTSPNIDDQRAWIATQRQRSQDVYWICENQAGTPLGTIGVYDIEKCQGEWGRFVIREGSKAAPGCLLLALTEAFETMGLADVVCTTVASNARAITFYERAGLRKDSSHTGHVVLAGKQTPTVAHHVTLETWPEVRRELEAAAAGKMQAVVAERS